MGGIGLVIMSVQSQTQGMSLKRVIAHRPIRNLKETTSTTIGSVNTKNESEGVEFCKIPSPDRLSGNRQTAACTSQVSKSDELRSTLLSRSNKLYLKKWRISVGPQTPSSV